MLVRKNAVFRCKTPNFRACGELPAQLNPARRILRRALLAGLTEAAPAPVVVERTAVERATALRRGREAIRGKASVAQL